MNAIIRSLLCAAALATPTALFAQPPATTGTVLLIDYDRLVEGKIERAGERFRICENGGGEISVPATAGMILLPDRESAYRLVKSRAKAGDPLEHVRLARWCLSNHFNQHAVEEAEAAFALRPDDRAFARFCDEVKQRSALAPPPSAAAAPTPKLSAPEPDIVDVNPESFSVFVRKVQPILVNSCANCHATERGGQFRLIRPSTAFGDQRATQANLAAASAMLNHDNPAASPLLLRAVSVHGNSAHPPLRDRQIAAFKHLEEWARLATGKAVTPPTPPPATLPSEVVESALPLKPENPAPKPAFAEAPAVVLPAIARDPAKTPAPAKPPATPITEPPKAEPSDPFDPSIFNKLSQPADQSPQRHEDTKKK